MADWQDERDLARALAEREDEAWVFFNHHYVESHLKPYAERLVKSWPTAEASDIVQGFLSKQVFGKEQTFFHKVIQSERELLPWLMACLYHHFIEETRKWARTPRVVPLTEEACQAPAKSKIDDKEVVDPEEKAREMLEEVREALKDLKDCLGPRDKGVPYCAILLLSERIERARRIAEALRNDEISLINEPIEYAWAVIEAAIPWSEDIGRTRLSPEAPTLDGVWARLTRINGMPGATGLPQIDFARVVGILGISRNRWDQWTRRARERVIDHLGDEKAESLFPHWRRFRRRREE